MDLHLDRAVPPQPAATGSVGDASDRAVDARPAEGPRGAAPGGSLGTVPDAPELDPLDEPAGGGVVLRLAGSRYVIEMAAVAEVVPLSKVTRVPGTPGWLTGVANWRGRILPVVDIRPVLGVEMTALPSSTRLLVLSADGCTAALVAEAVPGVHAGSLGDAASPPPTLAPDAALLVTGHVFDDFGPIAVIDPAAVLGLRSRLERRRRTAS